MVDGAHVPFDRVPFAPDEVAHDGIQTPISKVVRAMRDGRLEAARELVLATGTGLEELEPARDALLDRRSRSRR